MTTHLSINHGLGCLTAVIWPFTLMLVLCITEAFKLEFLYNFVKKVYCSPILEMADIYTKVKAVRVNCQITEVKQPRPWLILVWETI